MMIWLGAKGYLQDKVTLECIGCISALSQLNVLDLFALWQINSIRWQMGFGLQQKGCINCWIRSDHIQDNGAIVVIHSMEM